MTPKSLTWLLVVVCSVACAVYEVAASEPVFLSWLAEKDPGDQVIREYWERYEKGELDSDEMVDLGTMLFYRGYPRDAIKMYKASLDEDKKQYEPWFRIGLVEHQQGNLRQARAAYKKSLDLFKGQGWCNFYLGLLEEHEGNSQKAMKHFRRAFKYAPELADEDVNPEMGRSELSLGAWLVMARQEAFKQALPMPYMEPKVVQKVRASYQPKKKESVDETAPFDSDPLKPAESGDTEVKGELKPAAGGGAVIPVTTTKPPQPNKTNVRETRTPRKPRRPKAEPRVKPTPKPRPVTDDDLPYGLPGNKSVSPEAYPGF